MEVADALSRLPISSGTRKDESDTLCVFETTPLMAKDVAKASKYDATLSKVYRYTLEGWPAQVKDTELVPYYNRRAELSLEAGCVTWGSRVIVPTKLHDAVLGLLHAEHPGASRMKMLARSLLWWPGLDADIERAVKMCSICQEMQNSAPRSPLEPWPFPARCWQRVLWIFLTLKKLHSSCA